MTWHTLAFEPRAAIKATEARLDAIYGAAKKGLKGDTLALAAGLLPVEYRRLAEFDPLVEMAAQKGRADGEQEVSSYLHAAAAAGDTKAAIDILKHVHGWVARQAIDVTIDQTISVKRALEMAQQRVDSFIETEYEIMEATDAATSGSLLTEQLEGQADGPDDNYRR